MNNPHVLQFVFWAPFRGYVIVRVNQYYTDSPKTADQIAREAVCIARQQFADMWPYPHDEWKDMRLYEG